VIRDVTCMCAFRLGLAAYVTMCDEYHIVAVLMIVVGRYCSVEHKLASVADH